MTSSFAADKGAAGDGLATTGRGLSRIAASTNCTYFVDARGDLWAWGTNTIGSVGDGTYEDRPSPVKIGTDFAQVFAGGSSFALKRDGVLWGWSNTSSGTLGNGEGIRRPDRILSPVEIGGGFVQVASGRSHTAAIKADGSLWTWGSNSCGRLGDGTTTNCLVPHQIGTEFVQVAAGAFHSVAVKRDGSLWGWGLNDGAIGETPERHCLLPVLMGHDFVQAAVGQEHTVALKNDGTVWVWGKNNYWQLGVTPNRNVQAPDGTVRFEKGIDSARTPLRVGEGFTFVTAGYGSTLALKADGTLWGWGFNDNWQLGVTSPGMTMLPAQVGTDFVEVVAGPFHSAGLKRDGSLWTWGSNDLGQLGDGTVCGRRLPARVVIPGWESGDSPGFLQASGLSAGQPPAGNEGAPAVWKTPQLPLNEKRIEAGGFVAGTPVLTERGLVAIEEIIPGDRVLARSALTGQVALKTVLARQASDGRSLLVVKFHIVDPREKAADERVLQLYVSQDQPIWCDERGWSGPKSLYDDRLLLADGKKADHMVTWPLVRTPLDGIAWVCADAHAFRGRFSFEENGGHVVDFRGPCNFWRYPTMKPAEAGPVPYLEYQGTWGKDAPFERMGLIEILDSKTPVFTGRVFNLEVEDFHSFMVGEQGVWVGDLTVRQLRAAPAVPMADFLCNA